MSSSNGLQPRHDNPDWRIAYRPHTAPGGPGYARAYGWGYVSVPGALLVIVGTAGVMIKESPLFWTLLGAGMLLVLASFPLNVWSARRHMRLVWAQCVDTEIRLLRGTPISNGGWALRALVRFDLDGRKHEATPGRFGFDFMPGEETARRFAEHLRKRPVQLWVDPQHPQLACFKRLRP